jgi:prepilin-type N-terminal cleavage/methylation domain-containing protein
MIAMPWVPRTRRGRRQRSRTRRGFSLAEVMAAIVVFAIGLLGSAGVMASNIRNQRLAVSRAEMVSIADVKIDELRVIGQTPLGHPLRAQLAIGGSTTSSVNGYYSVVDVDGRSYVRRWQIAADPTGARRVAIRVVPVVPGNYQWGRVEFSTLVAF